MRPALAALRTAGLWLGIVGNQTVRADGILHELFTNDVDLIGPSDNWGPSKPDPEFFRRVAAAVPFEAAETHRRPPGQRHPVGSGRAGMATALIQRGPWGIIQQHDPDAERLPTFRIDGLSHLPGLLARP